MRYVPIVVLLLALVAVMGGLGSQSLKATRSMVLTIVGGIVIMMLFGLVLNRTL